MKIINARDFYRDKNSSDIRLYKEYLVQVEKRLNDAIEEATNLLGANDHSVVEMQNQRSFVRTIRIIIDSSTREIMFNSLNKFSDNELVEIINASVKRLEDDRDKINEEIEDLTEKRDKEYEEYLSVMRMNGYSDEYYRVEDSSEFFSEMLPAGNYVLKLITSNMDRDTLKKDIFSTLYTMDSVNEKLADMIISLRKIAKVSDSENLKRAIAVALRPEKVGKIIGIEDENECYRTFSLIQKEVKMKTKFYRSLALPLQKDIANNGFDSSSTYKRLSGIYNDYKKNGSVTVPESADITLLNNEIEKLKNIMSGYDARINFAKSTRESRQQMEELIKNMINAVPFEEGWNIAKVTETVNNKRQKEAQRRAKYNELKQKSDSLAETIGLIRAMLVGDKLEEDMQIIDARDKISLFDEEKDFLSIENIINAENRRWRQIEVLTQAIYELNEIKAKIDEVNNNHNLFKKVTGANRMLKEELLEQYQKIVTKYFNQLKQEGLLLIIASNTLDIDDEERYRPETFASLFDKLDNDLRQHSQASHIRQYHINEDLYREFMQKGIFKPGTTREKVNDSLVNLWNLLRKLFSANLRSDGVYEFDITDNELSLLYTLQQELVTSYEELRKARMAEKDAAVNMSMGHFSEEFMTLCRDLFLNLNGITRSTLEEKCQELSDERYGVNNEALELANEATDALESNEPLDMLEGFADTTISSDFVMKTVRL